MAQGDINLQFSNAQAITASAASTNTYDLLTGTTVTTTFTAYNASPGQTWGNATYFGEDAGIGPRRVKLGVWTGTTAFATGTSLQISWQTAPDSGGTTVSGLTFTNVAYGGAIPVAALTASTQLTVPDYPYDQVALSNPPPRFIRLYYTVAGSNFTTGALTAGVFLNLSFNRLMNYPSGFSVGA